MISGVTKTIDGEAYTFRMSTRAMMAIEDQLEAGIAAVLEGLEKGFTIRKLVVMLSECAGNGEGKSAEFAQWAVDTLGLEGAGALLGEIAEAAFPDAKGQPAKNAKGAARSK